MYTLSLVVCLTHSAWHALVEEKCIGLLSLNGGLLTFEMDSSLVYIGLCYAGVVTFCAEMVTDPIGLLAFEVSLLVDDFSKFLCRLTALCNDNAPLFLRYGGSKISVFRERNRMGNCPDELTEVRSRFRMLDWSPSRLPSMKIAGSASAT